MNATEKTPRIVDVMTSAHLLTVNFDDGRVLSLPLEWYPRLAQASAAGRRNWELVGEGQGIHWPELDEDLSAEGLIAGRRAVRSPAGRTAGSSPARRAVSTRLEA